MSEDNIEAIKLRIAELSVEHRDLDMVIQRLAEEPAVDQLQVRRLKKRKLFLKDMISKLQSMLIPDMPA